MSENITYKINADGSKTVVETNLSTQIDKRVREYIKSRYKVAELDAELNGGALFEVANVLGKPLYVRLDHHDPERAKAELAKIQSIVKSVVLGDG